MKKLYKLAKMAFTFILLATLNLQPALAQTAGQQSTNAIELRVNADSTIQDLKRVGINMAHWTVWGPEQFSRNILMNPGFEGEIDRSVVIVTRADQNSFSDGRDLGQADGHWIGATYDIRTGPNAGTMGTISNSLRMGVNGEPQ